MFKNYIKIAWRNIRKHRLHSIINIVGLFAGILFSFLIGAYVWSELQVNHQLKNAENQYILTSEWKDPNMGYDLATLGPLAKTLKEDYPNLIKNYYRYDGITVDVSMGNKHFKEIVQLGDSTLLKMYGLKTLYGDATTALNEPFSTVLTKSTALKYFGKENIIGETITYKSFSGERHDFKITAVLADPLENSVTVLTPDYPGKIFVPTVNYNYFGRNDLNSWNNNSIASYIELQNGVNVKDLQVPIRQLLKQHTSDNVQKNLLVRPIPLTEYHLIRNNAAIKKIIYTLLFVGLFIILMAIINFINVSISNAGTRMKEIGVRKVVGGRKQQLIFQFLSESFILVSIATFSAILTYPFAKDIFSGIVGKQLPALNSFPVYFLLIPFFLILIITALSGSYPAFRLSSINTINAMKGSLKSVGENVLLRKGLIAFQFVTALVVMAASLIITRQVAHFFSKKIGYNKDFIVSAQVPRNWTKTGVDKMIALRDQFAKMPEVSSVTLSYEIPNGNNGGSIPVYKSGEDSTRSVTFQLLSTDEKYLDTYQIPLKEGRFFEGYKRDSGQVIINETAVKAMDFGNATDAIGKQVRIPGDPTLFTIKGIMQDFHFGPMSSKIAPTLAFNLNFNPTYRFLSFKLKPGNIQKSITAIQNKWAALLPETSFEYRFMDESLRIVYARELQLQKAAYTATVLTIIIVLLGIFSMVSLSIQRRIKEIGVRKVLGASLNHIIFLFTKEFLSILLVASLVAIPIGYWIMQKWLQNYVYHISLSVLSFLVAVACIGVIISLLITIQTIKAGTGNPVKSLRTE